MGDIGVFPDGKRAIWWYIGIEKKVSGELWCSAQHESDFWLAELKEGIIMKNIWRRVIRALVGVSLLAILLGALPISASPNDYVVIARDFSSQGRGTFGWNNTYSAVVFTELDNSIMVTYNALNWIELGWQKRPNQPEKFFWNKMVGGWAGGPYYLGNASIGNHAYRIRHLRGTAYWQFWIDGAFRGETDHYFVQAWSEAMGERHNLLDAGWAHFWGLGRARLGDWEFVGWGYLGCITDTDPDYGLHKISNTEFWSEQGNWPC